MKSYTFKIKYCDELSSEHITLFAIHCPYEVLYDSVKQTKELNDKRFFVTVEEVSEFTGYFMDSLVGECSALFKSNDLKEWLLKPYNAEWLEEEVKEDGKDL